MGNTQSRFGYHVLKVKLNSPASKAGLNSYFDYIVAINDQLVAEQNQSLLSSAAKASLEAPLSLTVYNSRNDSVRKVDIVPSLNWGDENGGMLGCSVRFIDCTNARDRVWHILSVTEGSSGSKAGLKALTDFIVASLDKVLIEEDDFSFLIEKNPGSSLRFVVFNSEKNECREISIEVERNEFGKGVIGCEIGYGTLHQIPSDIPPALFNQVVTPIDGQLPADTAVQIPNLNEFTENSQISSNHSISENIQSVSFSQDSIIQSLQLADVDNVSQSLEDANAEESQTGQVPTSNLQPVFTEQFSIQPDNQSSIPTSCHTFVSQLKIEPKELQNSVTDPSNEMPINSACEYPTINSADSLSNPQDEINIDNVIISPQQPVPTSFQIIQSVTETQARSIELPQENTVLYQSEFKADSSLNENKSSTSSPNPIIDIFKTSESINFS